MSCAIHDSELDGGLGQEQMWFSVNSVVNHYRDQIGVNEDG